MLPPGGLRHAPGVLDPVTALLAVAEGFSALHLSGAAVSAVALGKPDLGFVHATDIAAVAARITSAVDVPLIADADTGYGGVLQVAATVEAYAKAGVAALHLEDQVSPKRCGHLAGKEVLDLPEAVARRRCGHVVFEGDEVARRALDVAQARREQLGNRVFAVDRHQLVA